MVDAGRNGKRERNGPLLFVKRREDSSIQVIREGSLTLRRTPNAFGGAKRDQSGRKAGNRNSDWAPIAGHQFTLCLEVA